MSVRKLLKAVLAASALTLAGCGSGGGGGNSGQLPPPFQSRPPSAGTGTTLAAAAVPIRFAESDYNDIIRALSDARFVLLGESTHGTHEYYRERARISERLIRERGFNAVLIEGDWSPTYRVNQYVRGLGSDSSAEQALGGYTRFPRWMWGNTDFRDFVERVRAYNLTQPAERRVGIYGMDVYDIFDAADAVVAYLRGADPAAARRAERQYACFKPFHRDTADYGASTRGGRSCKDEAAAVEAEVQRIARPTGAAEVEAHFAARRAAASVLAGEEYFRTAYTGSMAWNARDRRMAQNVEAAVEHLSSLSGQPGKAVVWSHNSHTGDARATYAANRGELTLGQLMRERHGNSAFLLGFLTHGGTVMAAPEWDRPGRVYTVRPALADSDAGLFHTLGIPNFSLLLRRDAELKALLGEPRLQRAIGVIYAPQSERQSHYFDARLSEQFDAVIYFDQTKAVTPIR
jgi:erythromycin esterase-like protein